jgi:hypothetical protein
VGELTLVGYDLYPSEVKLGGRMNIVLYWSGQPRQLPRVSVSLGNTLLESHQYGFGNLARYLQTVDTVPENSVVLEDYSVVIPSTLSPGEYNLTISIENDSQTLDTIIIKPD